MNNKKFLTSIGIAGLVLVAFASQATGADIVTATDSLTIVTRLKAFDLEVKAASETAVLQLHFAGADRIDHGPAGELYVMKADGSRVHYRPEAYQMINGKMQPVMVSYKLKGKDCAIVKFGKFDKSAPVILRRGAATL